MAGTRDGRILRPVPHRARRTPRAFTLLELLASMGMGLMVLAALYHAMFQTLFAVTEGEKVVVQSQLARAVMNLIAGDLRCALSGEGLDEAHFSGSANRVSVCTARVPTLPAAGGEGAPQASDVVKVTYSIQGTTGDETEAVQGVSLVREEKAAVGAGASRGLMDDTALDFNASDTPSPVASTTRVLTKDLAAMHLRYSDGGQWKEEWDSRTEGGPPKAVEISLTFLDAVQGDPGEPVPESIFTTEGAARVFRLVVYLPTGGKPEDVTSLIRRRKGRLERAIERTFTDTWNASGGAVERGMKRRPFSARSEGLRTRTVVDHGASATPARKTRAGAWGLRPVD